MKTKRNWLMPVIFFGALLLIGAIAGILTGVLTSNYAFLICFFIAFPFSLGIYFLWGLMASSNDQKSLIRSYLSIIGRFLCAIAAVGFSFLYLYLSSESYLYLLVAPTQFLCTSILVIGTTVISAKKRED